MFVMTESEVVADRLEADMAAAAGLWHVACAQVVQVLALGIGDRGVAGRGDPFDPAVDDVALRGVDRSCPPTGGHGPRVGRAVIEAIATVFRRFDELGRARQVMLSLRGDGVLIPRRPTGAKRVSWAPPTYPAIHDFLTIAP